MTRYEESAACYELRNDTGFNYSLVHYYITVEDQLAQLSAHGYCSCRAVGLDGSWLAKDDFDRRADAWIYYVAWAGK